MSFFLSCVGCVCVGVILSAPMGPVGMLCVQQTLNKGRSAGLLTGFGAALSDWFYCWVVALSMTLIINFIERHTAELAIVGGVLLAFFSIVMMRARPQTETSSFKATSGIKAVIAGFLLAFSNPLIIFLIMPLLIYFDVPQPSYQWWHYSIAMTAILVGAMMWWLSVAWLVSHGRRSMSLVAVQRVNRVMGGIMLCLSAYSLWRGVNLIW